MSKERLESSDLVAKFQDCLRDKVTTKVEDSILDPDPLITDRLSRYRLNWSGLDSLVKQALLWDMGFVRYSPDDINGLVQVYTKCDKDGGKPMSSIVLTKVEYEKLYPKGENPPLVSCSASDGSVYFRQSGSNGNYLQSYSNCAIPNINLGNIRDSQSSMWAQDATGSNTVPTPRVYRHTWEDKLTRSIFAIHTQLHDSEITLSQCPLTSSPGAAVFPCRAFDQFNNSVAPPAGFCLPAPSPRMSAWLKQLADEAGVLPGSSSNIVDTTSNGKSSLSVGAIVGIVVGALVLLAIIVFLLLRCRNTSRKEPVADFHYEQSTNDEGRETSNGTTTALATINYQQLETEALASVDNQPLDTSWQLFHPSSHILNEFQRDPALNKKRVPYTLIDKTRKISKGAFGEIWLGLYNGYVVAIKCLFESKRASEDEIEKFSDEIRLMASFSHPNIVRFIAFAWDDLENLCAVIEYMSNGDLESFLRKNEQLTWSQSELIKIARGIADGLAYLHNRDPKIIHRDLKAKNVLMGKDCVAKLTDFGISRESYDATLTAAVGTFYWTAPEVLIGGQYSEKADIYSFGCVLVEMDTRQAPFHDSKDVPRHLQMHHVTEEGLRPVLSQNSPSWLQNLVSCCFDADPSRRPSADEISEYLIRQKDE